MIFLSMVEMHAYDRKSNPANLSLDPYFWEIAEGYQSALREVLTIAIKRGIPVPSFSAL